MMWWEQAECAKPAHEGLDWHPLNSQGPANGAYDRHVATLKAVCDVCPVRVRCAEQAIEDREVWGVWAGVDLGSGTRTPIGVAYRRLRAVIEGAA